MANAEHFVQVHMYRCHNCDCNFAEDGPRKGHWFNTSEGWKDDDGDTFFEGEQKVLIGTPTYGCHNEDYPCIIDESQFTMVECEGYRCTSCGAEYMWDNDYCSEHAFDSGGRDRAERAASHCCTNGRKTPDNSGDLVSMGAPNPTVQKVTIIDL